MNTEATPVLLIYANDQDRAANKITMLKQFNGQLVLHKTIDGNKIIHDGECTVTKQEVVS